MRVGFYLAAYARNHASVGQGRQSSAVRAADRDSHDASIGLAANLGTGEGESCRRAAVLVVTVWTHDLLPAGAPISVLPRCPFYQSLDLIPENRRMAWEAD